MSDECAPGAWNSTVGYSSLSGRCVSSHRSAANTAGRPARSGDTFGVYVTHFGRSQSTVIFTLNDEPVASRYLFETDRQRFLPTITYENGATVSQCDLEVNLNESTDRTRSVLFHENGDQDPGCLKWIRPAEEVCHLVERSNFSEFENLQNSEDMPLQSPLALGRHFCHYKCTQIDFSGDGSTSTNINKKEGASVGLASCSPLKPTPTSTLLRDYYTWLPHVKCEFTKIIPKNLQKFSFFCKYSNFPAHVT